MEGERVEVGQLLVEAGAVARQSGWAAALYILVVGGCSTALNVATVDEDLINIVFILASLVGGYLLLRKMMSESGLIDPSGGVGFWAYFGLSLLSFLAIALCFLLLVIPAIIVTVRWLPAFAWQMAEENASASGALSESWDLTRDHFWPLLAANLVGFLPYAVGIVLLASADADPQLNPSGWLAAGDIFMASGTVLYTALGVAVYAMLRGRRSALRQTFA
jgi:hypothetical protein